MGPSNFLSKASILFVALGLAACGEETSPAGTPPTAPPATPFTPDECHGVPSRGRCISEAAFQHCRAGSEGLAAKVRTEQCRDYETCVETNGGASCVPALTCRESDTRCADGKLQGCTATGWGDLPCATSCQEVDGLAFCPPAVETTTMTGQLEYEVRPVNDTYTDWGELVPYSAPGFLVYSGTGDGVLGVTISDSSGGFSLPVRPAPDPGDFISVIAYRRLGDAFVVVANPNFNTSGLHEVADYNVPQPWSWSFPLTSNAGGQRFVIREADGSGAARIFDFLRAVSQFGRERLPERPHGGLVAWFAPEISWSCRACFGPYSVSPFNDFTARFESQIWISGESDALHWSDYAIAHELGHWWMERYAVAPNLGGPHSPADRISPGLAWSEGFATFFSSYVRQTPLCLQKHAGYMGYTDLESGTFRGGDQWPRAYPEGGLLQDISEAEVAGFLWHLSQTSGTAGSEILAAVSSPRMTDGPFERGYTAHGVSTPVLPDLLDALVCGGFSAASIDSVVQPQTRYPYPSASPSCR